jgi:hypothetical protein
LIARLDGQGHARRAVPAVRPVAELVDIRDGAAVLDARHRGKQADWSYDTWYSGKVPAECLIGATPRWR